MEASTKTSSKGLWPEVHDFFCSIKLSIAVLFALAVTSIFGTVIEQGKEPAAYVEAYGRGMGRLIQVLNLGDMYHSWWFLVLLVLLLTNIAFCSMKRMPHAIRLMRDRDPVFDGRPVAIHERWERVLKGKTAEQAAAALQELLSKKLGAAARRDVEGKVYLFASKGGWSRMGVYVTHFSLFLFAIGAQIGVWGGMKGFAQIPEGQSIREITLRDGKAKALDFEVRCDKFDVTFYLDPATGQPSGRPKDYVSQLTVLENGQVVRQQTVEVNHPLIYKGIYFYQSSYGQTGATAGYLSVYGERRNLLASGAKLPKGGALDLEGGTQLRMLDMTSDYAGSGPAALVALEKPGVGRMEPQVLRRAEGAPTAVGEYLVRLDGVEAKMYTGLQVAKDPGVPVIWAGCILITVGLLMAFFVSHKRVWVRVTPTSGGAEVLVAGNVSRNRVGFETWFSDLTESAQKSLAG